MEGTISNRALAKRFEGGTLGEILFKRPSTKQRVGSEYRPQEPRWYQKQASKRIARGFQDIAKD